LLASFGPVLALRERWDKGYVFVLYKEPYDAARCDQHHPEMSLSCIVIESVY
jgi:hypothetical protein